MSDHVVQRSTIIDKSYFHLFMAPSARVDGRLVCALATARSSCGSCRCSAAFLTDIGDRTAVTSTYPTAKASAAASGDCLAGRPRSVYPPASRPSRPPSRPPAHPLKATGLLYDRPRYSFRCIDPRVIVLDLRAGRRRGRSAAGVR